jgi:hypothetical protein
MTMTVDDFFPSNFLRPDDLKGKPPVTLTIDGVDRQEFRDGTRKPTLSFKGTNKKLILNKTICDVIADAFGRDMQKWPGHPITVFATRVEFSGKMVDAIRVRVDQAPLPFQQQAPTTTAADDMADSIPF